MRDVDNRLSSVDYVTPGGRFVDRQRRGREHQPGRAGAAAADPDSVRDVRARPDWDRGLLSPSKVRLAPRTGFALSLDDDRAVVRGGYGIFLNQWAYSVQTAFARNLPFFFTKQVDVPATQRVPAFQTRDILASDPTGVVGADHHGPRVCGRVHADVERRPAVRAAAVDDGRRWRTWDRGRWAPTTPRSTTCPSPGPGRSRRAVPIPQLGPIRSIRFDGKSIYHGADVQGGAPPSRTTTRTTSATRSRLRRTMRRARARPKRKPTFRRTSATSSTRPASGRIRASTTGTCSSPAGPISCRSSPARAVCSEALLGGWRVNAVFFAQSGAPFTVNLGVDQANIGAGPAQRPDQLRDPNLPAGERTPERWFDTAAFALPAPFTFGNAPRNSVIGPGFANLDLVVAKTWPVAGTRQLEFRWEVFNALNTANFDLPSRDLRHAELRPHLQRKESARNAVRRETEFLSARGHHSPGCGTRRRRRCAYLRSVR